MIEDAVETPLVGKKRNKKKSMIGIDPLAWMNNADTNNEQNESLISDEGNNEHDEVSEVTAELNAAAEETHKKDEVEDMDMEGNDIGLDGNFKLEGPITIADVGILHEKFLASLERDSEFEIDCSEVDGVDAAALQLLVSCVNEIEKQNKKLVWKNVSEAMLSAVNLLGLKNEFKI